MQKCEQRLCVRYNEVDEYIHYGPSPQTEEIYRYKIYRYKKRSSLNGKDDKKTHYNKSVKSKRQRKNIEGSKRKTYHHLKEIPTRLNVNITAETLHSRK